MQHNKYFYLIKIQYLGYRLHGWQSQPNMKTVEGLIKRTIKFVIPERIFKILGAGRTDAMVSAQDAAFELFLRGEALPDLDKFMQEFNKNLPQDIRAISIKEVTAGFNIIQHPKVKEYAYLFNFGTKNHPFCAALMANFQEDLNIDLMKQGAKLFEGFHNFKNYTVRASEKSKFERRVLRAEIVENKEFTANFFPEKSYLFHVHGEGFLRYQIRLMMGALILLGRGELQLEQVQESLNPGSSLLIDYIAPASGLILNKLNFKDL